MYFRSLSLALSLTLAGLPAALAAQESDASAQVKAPDPARLELAKIIVARGFPEESREEIFFAAVDQMTAQMREASITAYEIEDEGALSVLDGWLADYLADSKVTLRLYIPRLMDALAASYANIFTEQELADIAAFVSTPSGQRFMMLSSAAIAEPNFAAVNQAYMTEIQAGVPAAMADLQNRIVDYLQAQEALAAESES